jgi:hypothetical protein
MEKQGGKDGHQQEAELVYRGDFRRIPHLQGAKVADPRRSRGQSRQHQEKPVRVTRITTVRTNVAKSESMPAKPSLAKIAVSAANTADRRAQ